MNYSPEDVRRAIDGIRSKLGRTEDTALQEAFDAGLHPNLLAYGKLGVCLPSLPILDKYLIGATSFLHQPSNYYDIFRACRCVNIVMLLDAALEPLIARRVPGIADRLEKLGRAMLHDALDAVVFELVTASRYSDHPAVGHVEFIEESPLKKSPDFLIRVGGVESSVECKKVDRSQNFTISIRNAVCDHLNEVIGCFRSKRVSVLGDVAFNCDPGMLNRSALLEAFHAALSERTAIIEPDFSVTAGRLPPYQNDGFTLYPSPQFQWERYGYRVRSEWFGIVQQLYGSRGVRAGLAPHLRGGTSSWLDEVEWDAAIKWRVGSEELLARYRRFAFDGVFNGLKQIKTAGRDSVVHLWLETDYSIKGRRGALKDLLARVSRNASNVFGWIIINETLFDVSRKGRFDLIEHGHFVRGRGASASEALVCGVFTPRDKSYRTAEFGIGRELPDIDEEE